MQYLDEAQFHQLITQISEQLDTSITLTGIVLVINGSHNGPKEGKDPPAPCSYRPISLLNTDIKILARVLANRLKPILPTVINPDQTGFIAGREARDNYNEEIQLLHWVNSQDASPPCLFISTNAEKAFDRVDWA